MIKFLLTLLLILSFFVGPCLAQDNKPSEIDKAKTVIEQGKKDRIKKCSEDIAKVLKENHCTLEVGMIINHKGNIPQVQVVPVD